MSSLRWIPLLLALVCLVACKDKHKIAEQKAGPLIERLFPLIERDTKQLREGMPKGAAELGKHLDDDPAADPEGLRRAISRSRSAVKDLAFAKSTFFVFAVPDGTIVRSESDPDLAAGTSLIKAVPEAKKMFAPEAGVVELYGYVHGLRGAEKGGDLQWLVGHPVKSTKGKLVGAFVSGWSLRLYAQYLENDSRIQLTADQQDKTKPIPLVYVFLCQDDKAYGARVTPDENSEAVAKLGLPAKVQEGVYRTDMVLDGRKFAVAAKRAPKLGAGIVLAAMVSEF